MKDIVFKEDIQRIVSDLPDHPGVYQFFNAKGVIIYIGKAKSLKKRVSSYFSNIINDIKKYTMVNKIADIRTILVDSESDALLLENNLIKKYQPRYNVMLKDSKSYPWIVVRNEPFPRVYLMRNPVQDGSLYFGPYTTVGMIRSSLDLVKQIYQLRSCSLSLTDELIKKGKYKICLEYHLGNCKAPCIGQQTEEEYNRAIEQIKEILKGKVSTVIQQLKGEMREYADNYRFEQAEVLKNKITILEKYRNKSTIVNPDISNVDVFSYVDDIQCAYINYLHMVDGAIIQAHNLEIVKRLDEAPAELLSIAITELRERFQSHSKEIIVPFEPDVQLPNITYTIPKARNKQDLLKLSLRNSVHFQEEKKRQIEHTDPDRYENRILETLKHDLHLSVLPVRIECFDNSNIQGTYPVASCVVFCNARPSKKDYRHFNIKTVEGPDDFASMEEVVYRRYHRMQQEGEELPQLIVIDGGKGQLSSAVSSLEKLGLRGEIAIIGIAKRLEEIYFPGDSTPLYLDKRSESLRIIQQLRDEAHRFGISFHRDKRSKAMTHSELQDIKGIGEKTIELLLHQFKSVAQLKQATEEDIAAVVGKQKAAVLVKSWTSID
ncbi:MAG: excinuclease ABC subunit UvrC [Bacteroidales bacterium]|jgi:excinuclease ABC subunit C|nr:excinuclease ABC subunit UvrC [Bacteroidales bacterium]